MRVRDSHALNPDTFAPCAVTTFDRDMCPGYPKPFGQERYELKVGGPVDRSGREPNEHGAVSNTSQFSVPRSRNHPHVNANASRHGYNHGRESEVLRRLGADDRERHQSGAGADRFQV